ncbi:MAG: hypothetical protein K2Q18_06890 [Bdellovibrionales bacterium]|nr:hypothetical protein [Bdellovibrionales bacterium]
MKILIFLILILIFFQKETQALTNCFPTSCTPSCGTSCTYYTCSETLTHTFYVNKIPYDSDDTPPNACAHNPQSSNSIPFNVDGVTHSSFPIDVVHSYQVCKAETIEGPSCN